MQENKYKIEQVTPKVTLLHATPIWIAEVAARKAYDSFDKSEHKAIRKYGKGIIDYEELNKIKHSEILMQLAWVHHHHSVLEHITLNFDIDYMSRSVLQEWARHRIQSITARSTRYTMTRILNAFIAAHSCNNGNIGLAKAFFYDTLRKENVFIITDNDYVKLLTDSIYDKLSFSMAKDISYKDMLSKDGLMNFVRHKKEITDMDGLYKTLNKSKTKRNVGDMFKHIVDDNWRTELISSFNIRSLRNLFSLRDSGAAFFQIQWVMEEMKKQIPEEYLNLIIKKKD